MEMEFDAFISYSRDNLESVESFIYEIKKIIPEINFWFDFDGIESGSKFISKLASAIDNSKSVIFIVTQESVKSSWTQNEVMYAFRNNKTVYPILLNGILPSGWAGLMFNNVDCIDWTDERHRSKFINNLIALLKREKHKTITIDNTNNTKTTKDSEIFMLGFYMASLSVQDNFKNLFEELCTKLGITIEHLSPIESTSVIKNIFGSVVALVFEFGQVYFISSFARMMMLMGLQDTEMSVKGLNDQFVNISRRLCIPEYIINKYLSLNEVSEISSFVKVLQYHIDNRYKSVNKCRFCGADIASDASVCHNCNTELSI